MTGRPAKHSLTLRGHRTSVSLEPEFWNAFREIAAKQGKPLNAHRKKALKALLLCGLQECYDFGYELAGLFHELGHISTSELEALGRPASWRLGGPSIGTLPITAYGYFLRLFSTRMRKALADETGRVLNQPDLAKATMAHWRRPAA